MILLYCYILLFSFYSPTQHNVKWQTVRRTVSRCFAALRQLRSLRRYVTNDYFRSLVHRSCIDYGNFILVGVPAYLQWRLQAGLNAPACLVFWLRRYDHVTDALAILHWLRLPERVKLNWHLWHIEYCTVWRRRTWINSFRYQTYQVAAACGRRLHFSCSFRHTVCQPSAVFRFLLQHPSSGIHCLFTSSLHHLSTFRQRLKTFLFQQSLGPRHGHLTSLHCATAYFIMAICHFKPR